MEQNNISQKIQELRKQRCWSQIELAEKTGLSQSTIKDIETGRLKLTHMETVAKIINAFDISFDFLFKDFLLIFESKNNQKIEDEILKMNIEKLNLVDDIIDIITQYKKNDNN